MRRQPKKIDPNDSAALYWSDRLGFAEVPIQFRECLREHTPALFNVAWESLQNAERNGHVRDRQKYFLGALMGMMNDRNRERSGR